MSKSVLLVFTVSILLGFSAVVLKNRPISPVAVPDYQVPDMPGNKASHPVFEDVSWAYGLLAGHRQSSKFLSSSVESLGAGVCVADFNQDHWMDIIVVGGSGTTREYGKDAWWHRQQGDRLFLNQGGKYFEDISSKAGILKPFSGMGCAVADLDNDGLKDILISGLQGHLVYKNLGKNTFKPVVVKALNHADLWSTQAVLADINSDGLTDIYSTQFVHYRKGERTFEESQGFIALNKVDFNPELYDPQPNTLLINQGDLSFSPVNALDSQNVQGRSVGAIWYDFNRDNAKDLLIINGFGTANRIFLAATDSRFVEDRSWMRRAQIKDARSVLVEDFNLDGTEDIFVTSASGLRNTLLEHTHGTFEDTAEIRRLSKKSSLHFDDWGSVAADFNNDGYSDIYVASGKLSPDEDSPFVSKDQANRVYINSKQGIFSRASGDDPYVQSGSSRGVVSVDVDNDGILEVIVANNNGWVQLLKNRNTPQNSWIGFTLENTEKWDGGILTVSSDNTTWQKTVTLKQGAFSQSDPRIHFGLGDDQGPVSVTLERAGLKSISVKGLDVGKYYLFKHQHVIEAPQRASLQRSPFMRRLDAILDEERLTWSQMLIRTRESHQQELLALWRTMATSDKLELLSSLSGHSDVKSLAVLFEALRDNKPEVQIVALDILKLKEMERSVAWLLPMFASPHPQVVCKVSQLFSHFYEQEEAILHRKGLAAVPMMRALRGANPEQQLCLLEALAGSENKRAVEGIIDVLHSAQQPKVKAAAIHALGQIRDVKARDQILLALQNEQSPEIIAESLIALSRLRYTRLPALFSDLFMTSGDQRVQLQRLSTLLARKEDIVLPSNLIKGALDYQANLPPVEQNQQLLKAWFNVFSVHGEKRYLGLLLPFLEHANRDIQISAISNILTMADKAEKDRIESRILALPHAVKALVLEALPRDYRFGQTFLATLTARLLSEPHEQEEFPFFSLLPRADQASVMNLVLSKPYTNSSGRLLAIAADSCLPSDTVGNIQTRDFPVQQQWVLLNWLYGCTAVDEGGLQALESRVLLNKVLSSHDINRQQKVALISRASKNSTFVANQWLPGFIDELPMRTVLDIISDLPKENRNDALGDYLDGIIRDGATDRLDKLYAYSLANDARISQALKIAEN